MRLNKIFKNMLLVISAGIILTACATKKEVAVEAPKEETKKEEVTKIEKIAGQMQGDVYVGTDSVKYLADGVADRVFFATNESILTTASRETLRAQAAWLRENSNITVVLEGHADERGTREYNLALGERRANAAKDYLMTYGVSSDRITVISYGKERPVDSGSNPLAWSKNRRSVTVKAN
ncbi:peptidoglycan-associated lipoprotein Pal [Candidatus Pelagibacter sp. HIMB1587]|uniref:peptidoglycan-associated lipoprotein Pal n=1 Tax=Candidatus Pelagibacter sp. HIMB1587 TaxID=3413354 RepID=UPI003F846E43